MDQNVVGLVLKTSGYPDQVALSGYHGNQVNFKILNQNFHIQKIPNFAIIKIQSTFQLNFCTYELFLRFMAFSTHGNYSFFHRGQFLIIATISKKCPYFATRLCFHGKPGNHGNNLKIFSVPLAWPNI